MNGTLNFCTHPIKWVRLPVYCELTGEPEETVKSRIKQGGWIEGIHWKVIARRRWINLQEAQEWVEKDEVRAWRS